MSYTLKPNPPCKGCEDRHAKCHTTCPEYIEWNESRQAVKQKAYKRYVSDSEADNYRDKIIGKCKKHRRR